MFILLFIALDSVHYAALITIFIAVQPHDTSPDGGFLELLSKNFISITVKYEIICSDHRSGYNIQSRTEKEFSHKHNKTAVLNISLGSHSRSVRTFAIAVKYKNNKNKILFSDPSSENQTIMIASVYTPLKVRLKDW